MVPWMVMPFTVPIAVLGALVIWALPDVNNAPLRPIAPLFWAFFIAQVLWPNYLAITLPGLPWITMIRLTGFPLVFFLLVCVSVSAELRTQLAETLNAAPPLWKALAVFVFIQATSIALSHSPSDSFQAFLVAQLTWTAIFFISAWLFRKPGRLQRWAGAFVILGVVVAVIGLVEYRRQEVLWVGHIPSFLQVQDESVQKILAGSSRNGDYRAQSTFSTSLAFAEFLTLVLPFAIHFAMQPYRLPVRIAAGAAIPVLMVANFCSGARLGVVGMMLTIMIYFGFWSVLNWRKNKHNLLGPAIVFSYPALFLAAIASTFFVGRVKLLVWGNGTQQASTDSRKEQYIMGLPKVLKHPFGSGAGMGGDTLGYFNEAGEGSIDTYYLSVALEYGIIGFLVYYGIIIYSIYLASTYALKREAADKELGLLAPISNALINFLVIKSVFAQPSNHTLIFMMLGAIVALVYRLQKITTEDRAAITREVATLPGLKFARQAGR